MSSPKNDLFSILFTAAYHLCKFGCQRFEEDNNQKKDNKDD